MTKKSQKKKLGKKPSSYLVATFENFPGVEIPLLSEDECKACGLEPGKLPPFDTWSSEQQAAVSELAEILAQIAVREVLESEQSEEPS